MYWQMMYPNRTPPSGHSNTIIDSNYTTQNGNNGYPVAYRPYEIELKFEKAPQKDKPYRPAIPMTNANTLVFSTELVEEIHDMLDGVQVVPMTVREHDQSESSLRYNFINVMSIIEVHDSVQTRWWNPSGLPGRESIFQMKVDKNKLRGAPHLFRPAYWVNRLFVSEEFCKRYDSIGGTGVIFMTTDQVEPLRERPKPKKRRVKKSDP